MAFLSAGRMPIQPKRSHALPPGQTIFSNHQSPIFLQPQVPIFNQFSVASSSTFPDPVAEKRDEQLATVLARVQQQSENLAFFAADAIDVLKPQVDGDQLDQAVLWKELEALYQLSGLAELQTQKQNFDREDSYYNQKTQALVQRYFPRAQDCGVNNEDPNFVYFDMELRHLEAAKQKDRDALLQASMRAQSHFALTLEKLLQQLQPANTVGLELSADAHQMIGTFLEQHGENRVAYQQFRVAAEKVQQPAAKLFAQVRQYQQLREPELADVRMQVAGINANVQSKLLTLDFWSAYEGPTEGLIDDLQLLAAANEQPTGQVNDADPIVNDFVQENFAGFTAYGLLLSEAGNSLREKLQKIVNTEDPAKAQLLNDQALAEVSALILAKVEPEQQQEVQRFALSYVAEMLTQKIGSAETLRALQPAAEALVFSAGVGKGLKSLKSNDKEFEKELIEFESQSLQRITARLVQSEDEHLPFQELYFTGQTLGRYIEHATARNSWLEREFVDGSKERARQNFTQFRGAVVKLEKAFVPYLAGPTGAQAKELLAGLRMRIAYESNLMLRNSQNVMPEVAQVSQEYAGTKFIEAKLTALHQLHPKHVSADGQVNVTADFADTPEGLTAAVRERSVYAAKDNFLKDTVYVAGGTLVGSGLGCGVGAVFGIPGGPPGMAAGCEGGAWVGGIVGGTSGAYASQQQDVEKYRDEILAAYHSGLTQVTSDEYDMYNTAGGARFAMNMVGALAFAKPAAGITQWTYRQGVGAADWVAEQGGLRALGAQAGARVGAIYEGAVQGLRAFPKQAVETLQLFQQEPAYALATTAQAGRNILQNVAADMLQMMREMKPGERMWHLLAGYGSPFTEAVKSELARRGMWFRVAAHFGLVGKNAQPVGWRLGLSHLSTAVLHDCERIGLPVMMTDLALNYRDGKTKMSWYGSVAMMFFMNRIGVQYMGLDPASQRFLVFFDRVSDAVYQLTSGQPWDKVDVYRIGMNYFTGTIVGQWRGKLLRDLLSRKSQGLIRTITLKNGSQTGRLNFTTTPKQHAHLHEEEVAVVKRLLRESADHENVVVVGRDGAIYRASGVRQLGHGYRQDAKGVNNALLAQNKVGQLDEVEQRAFARALSNGASDNLSEQLSGSAGKQIKLGTELTRLKGTAAFTLVHDTIIGSLWDGTRSQYLMDADGVNVGMWTLTRSYTTLPGRNALKLMLGWDTARAVFWDRILGRYILDPVVSKWFPHYASKGMWEASYAEHMDDGVGRFINAHTGPKIWEGGLAAWRWHAPLSLTGENDDTVNDQSPFEPIAGAYERLSEFYKSSKFTDTQRLELDEQINTLVAYAKNRLAGRPAGERVSVDVRYDDEKIDDATIVETALAVSAAAMEAQKLHPEWFPNTLRNHGDWFEMLQAVGVHDTKSAGQFVGEFDDADYWKSFGSRLSPSH